MSPPPASSRFKLTPKQIEANRLLGGPQRHTLLVGGARSGKTFLTTRAIVTRALRAPNSRHAIIRLRANAVWNSIGRDTLPAVMRKCFPGVVPKLNKSDRFATFPNGSEIWLVGLDDQARVEKILGFEFVSMYFNEASQIPYSSYLVAKTRLAQVCPGLMQREYADLNPGGSGHWTRRLFIEKVDPDSRKPLPDPDDYAVFHINPADNAANLSPEFLRSLENLPERQRKRFWEGAYTTDVEGALWPMEIIDRARCLPKDVPDLRRVVVAVDPSGAAGKEDVRSDEIGIVVVGLAGHGDNAVGYVLADRTIRDGPAGWGKAVARAYEEFSADAVVAEINYGKAMVEFVMKTADPKIPIHQVHASRGKYVRAEPVSALYAPRGGETFGRVRHVGRFAELEDQMSNFSVAGYVGQKSPDRADALVWGLTHLMLSSVEAPRAPAPSYYQMGR